MTIRLDLGQLLFTAIRSLDYIIRPLMILNRDYILKCEFCTLVKLLNKPNNTNYKLANTNYPDKNMHSCN